MYSYLIAENIHSLDYSAPKAIHVSVMGGVWVWHTNLHICHMNTRSQ